jgi:cell division transport system permease protein
MRRIDTRPLRRSHSIHLSISGRSRYFIREAFRRLWISRRTSFVAILLIALALSTVGVFLLASQNIDRALQAWQGRSKVIVYFEPSAGQDAIDRVNHFLSAREGFEKRTFVSREEAAVRFREMFSSLGRVVDELEHNPFPPSMEIEVSRATIDRMDFDDDISALRKVPGVDEVQFDWDWLARLRRLVRAINSAGVLAGTVLALAAAFMIANVIRLTMFLYRDEIEIMRLVGATEAFVRGPFLVEGFLQGLAGAVLALGALYGFYEWGRYAVMQQQSAILTVFFQEFLTWEKAVLLLAGGTAAGLLGSWISVRESTPEPYA